MTWFVEGGCRARVQQYLAVEAECKCLIFSVLVNPDATVGEVLGTRQTIVFAPMQLASGLPYTLQAVTARYSEIPQPLRHTYRVTLAEKTPLAQSTGATVIDVSIPLSVVTRKALALSFVPATQADEDVLLSYLPQDGNSSLPTELPGYLIDMKAQLTLDGEVVGEGGVFPMGTELNLTHYFTDPRRTVKPVSSNVIAGEYHAIGVDGGQINLNLLTKTKAQLEQAKTELEAIKAQLDNNQTPTIGTFLSKHTLTGNLLQTGILGYFAINDSLDQLDARSMGVVTQRLPSFGTFATSLEPQYLFGSIPRNVKLAGLSMDVDRFSTLAMAKDGSNPKNIAFFRATGPRKSAFEHLVPEQLFSTAAAPAQAVSAVKALAIAAQQGQKIYTLTKANAAQRSTLTISQTAKTDIAAALNAGKEVTVHQSPITYAGWTGEGYIVLDPNTGAGAYKLVGGKNGSNTEADSGDEIALLGVSLSTASRMPIDSLDQVAETSAVTATAGFLAHALSCDGQTAIVAVFALALMIVLLARFVAVAIAIGWSIWRVLVPALLILSSESAGASGIVFDPGNVACACPPERLNSLKTQCWVCELSQKEPARLRVEIAKQEVSALGGGCAASDPRALLVSKLHAWDELGDARDFENGCYEPKSNPPGPNHRVQAEIAHQLAGRCAGLLVAP